MVVPWWDMYEDSKIEAYGRSYGRGSRRTVRSPPEQLSSREAR